MKLWLILAVIFYPAAMFISYWTPFTRIDRLSALASGLIVFMVLWLYLLPRNLAIEVGPIAWHSRFVLPLTAYLCGLVVAAVLMSWTKERPA